MQPTQLPTNLYPYEATYIEISFNVNISITGVNVTLLREAAYKIAFRRAIESSITGVRKRDVHAGTMRCMRTSLTAKVNLFDRGSYANVTIRAFEPVTVDEGARSRSLEELAVTTQGVDYLSTCTIVCNVTIELPRIGFTNVTSAYKSIIAHLDAARRSGSFTAVLVKYDPSLGDMTVTNAIVIPAAATTRSSVSKAPTAPPSIVTIVPTVVEIVVTDVDRVSVSIAATLNKEKFAVGDFAIGTLYCTILQNGTEPKTAGSVKAAAVIKSSKGASAAIAAGSSFPQTLKMTFNSLMASESYAVFCYAETSGGRGSSLSSVLKTKKIVTTECCKMISFTNTPAFVYLDLSKYIGASSSLYVFTYSLPVQPSSELRVFPVLSLDGAVSTDVLVTPSATTFSPSLPLEGKFFLSSRKDIAGNYTLSLKIDVNSTLVAKIGGQKFALTPYVDTAPAGNPLFVSTPVFVQLLSLQSPVPAPILTSVQFTDGGEAVFMLFNSPTDEAGIKTADWRCSSIFEFKNASQTICEWVNATAVRGTFGGASTKEIHDALLRVGDSVTLIPSILRAFCSASATKCSDNPYSVTTTKRVLAPSTPTTPTAIIIAPRKIGACSDLTLDASQSYGNGGRFYNFVLWSVTANLYQDSVLPVAIDTRNVTKILNDFSAIHQMTRPITISRTHLEKGTYTFTVTAQNFFGINASDSFNVDVTGGPKTLAVTIIGPKYLSIRSSSNLTIAATALSTACSKASSAALQYTWSVQRGTAATSIKSSSLNPLQFSLPAFELLPDNTYYFRIEVAQEWLIASALLTVYVDHGPVTAAVKGGYSRSIPVDKRLTLDASISTDADVSPFAASGLSYQVSHRSHCHCLYLPCFQCHTSHN
jgi:REJ domain